MNDLPNVKELDRRAVEATRSPVAAALRTPHLPSPCEDWNVGELIAHMTGQQIGFAAAARGHGANLAQWRSSDADYDVASDDVVAAFAALTADALLELPEISGSRFPATTAVLIHLVDNVVHAWDVAVSVGSRPDLDAEVVAVAAQVAATVPNGAAREEPGAAFGPALPPVAGDDDLSRMLRTLGRNPAWATLSR